MTGATALQEFQWETQPRAAALVREQVDAFCRHSPWAEEFRTRLLRETGTRLADWLDHLALPRRSASRETLETAGFRPGGEEGAWIHEGGLFPAIRLADGGVRLAIKVESVVDFLAAHGLAGEGRIVGEPGSPFRTACAHRTGDNEFWVVERHGYRGWEPVAASWEQRAAAARHWEAFRLRQRFFDRDAEGFDHAVGLFAAAAADLGRDWACDLFFCAEREYWQRRNRAARVQRARQDALGLGWANHDHHTYRASRSLFPRLIAVLEAMGFHCRERFYAGQEAGWGAQVLEQPTAGIVIFADVDLAPDEVMEDFAHDPLPARDKLGTIGLWCALHGEAFLQAGMHHLECQFDFEAARQQLAADGVTSMKPFTDFPYLRQSFTEAEIWPVAENRLASARDRGWITTEQANQFRQQGAVGSHLEVLQRNDGYKGFNQTGVSEIILATDPRK